jgi:hypothetical protein
MPLSGRRDEAMDWLICVGAGLGLAGLLLVVHVFEAWANEAENAGAYRRKR